MKIPEELKRKFKFKPKNEKGSVTLFVLIAMLFFLTVGVIIFITNMNNSTSQQKDYNKIQKDYNNVANGNLDTIYDEQEAKVTNKIQIIVRDADGNVYKEGDWTNNIPLSVEVIWPKEIQSNSGSSNKKQIAIMHGISTTTYTDSQISSLNIVDDGTYNIFAQINDNKAQLTVKVDTTAPTVAISPNGGTTYINPTTRKLLDSIEITAEDNLSGLKTVEYIISTSGTAPLANDANWTTYETIDEIQNAQDGEIYYVYTKVTDNIGNVDIVKSNAFEITDARATFDTGTNVNVKMKTLAGNTGTIDTDTVDELITKIELSSSIPAEYRTDANKVSTADSKLPIYMWAVDDPDNTGKKIIKWFTDDPHPYMNESNDLNNRMFKKLAKLSSIPEINIIDTSKTKSMSNMFQGCKSLKTIDVSKFDTSNVASMWAMFYECNNLEEIDLSHFNTAKVTNMGAMLYKCNKLTELDVSKFDTSKVTNMQSMFNGCGNLTSLDLSGFNTQNVTNMQSMFRNCLKLTTLNLSGFNTSKVTNMMAMFNTCQNLTTIDLTSFNTSSVTSMRSMFYKCINLVELDLRNFNTSSVTNMWKMFSGCSNLTTIYASDKFVTTALTGQAIGGGYDATNTTSSHLFEGCTKLVGGSGTPYSAEHVNADYARIDGLNGLPGYFTNHYFIEFNANTENAQGTMTNQGIPFSYSTNLKENGFTKEGYIFRGWATSPNGPVVYENGASMNYDLDGIKAVVTDAQDKADDKHVTLKLYAVWSQAHYNVTYGSPATTVPAETLEEAVAIAEAAIDGTTITTATITATADYEDNSTATISKNIVLDLAGHTITTANTITNNGTLDIYSSVDGGTLTGAPNYTITNTGTFTTNATSAAHTMKIENTTTAAASRIISYGASEGTITINANSTLEFTNSRVSGSEDDRYIIINRGITTINGATLKTSLSGTEKEHGVAIPYNGTNGRIIINDGTTINVTGYALFNNGSTLKGNTPAIEVNGTNTTIIANQRAINNYKAGDVIINAGNITASTTLSAVDNFNTGSINVIGGHINSNGGFGINNRSTGIINVSGGTISGIMGICNQVNSTINVTGGNITGTSHGVYNSANGTINVSGANTKITGTNGQGIRGYTGIVNVNNGTIKGKTYGIAVITENEQSGTILITGGKVISDQRALYAQGNATITLGIKDESVPSKTSPEIISNTTETYNAIQLEENTIFNFYDGKVTGRAGGSINKEPTAKPNGYQVVKTTTEGRETAVLEKEMVVTADANGGTMSTPATEGWINIEENTKATKTVVQNTAYGDLPSVSRTGYTFKGWNGKNLFDEESILMAIDGATKENNHYVFTFLDSYNKYGKDGNMLPLNGFKANTSYTLTINGYVSQVVEKYGGLVFHFHFTDDTNHDVKINNLTENTINYTTPNNKTISYITVTYGSGGAFKAYISSIQLEEGSTATAYEPYIIESSIIVTQDTSHTLKAVWEANDYKVKFNGDNATSGTMADQNFKYDQEKALTQNAYTRAYTVTYNGEQGTPAKENDTATYQFTNWINKTTSQTYQDKAVVKNLTTEDNGEVALYAVWNPQAVTLPTATREGYIFNGWYDAATGGNKIGDAGDKYIPEANTSLHAQWRQVHYTISVGTENLVAETMQEAIKLAEDRITGSVTTATISATESYTDNSTANITKKLTINIPSGKTITMGKTLGVTGEVTFTGSGKLKRGTVATGDNSWLINDTGKVIVDGATLEADGSVITGNGSHATGSIIVNSGEVKCLGTNGYNTASALYVGTVEVNGGKVTSNSQSGYAIASNNCTITGGNISANATAIVAVNNGRITVSGDSTSISGSCAIGNGADAHINTTININGGTLTGSSNVIRLFAAGQNVTITGGTITCTGANNAIYSTGANSTVTIGNSASTFNQITPSIQGGQYSVQVTGSGSTLNYYDGKLIGKKHDKTYDGREVTFSVGDGVTVTPLIGYKPYTRQNGDYYETVLEKEVTVTADSGAGTITATNGWTLAQDGKTATKKVLQNTLYGTLPTKDEMKREGYTFKGWYTASTGGTEVDASTPVTSDTDHKIYANWTANSYTVTLNAGDNGTINEAAGWNRTNNNKTATKDITYDGAYGTLPTASRPGYNFDGWFTEATGGTEVKADTIMQTASAQTLHAHWTARTDTPYTVKHYKQNIDGTYPSTPADTDNLTGTTDTSVTPERKTYTGFNSPAGATLTIKGDGTAVLEYKYSRKSYTVTYNYSENGGTTATKTTDTKKYEEAIDLTPTATKSGYDFVGWNTDKDAHVALTSKNMPADNVTLYAIYKKDIKITTYQYKNAKTENTATLYNKDANVSVTLPTIADKKVGDITYTARGWSEATTANGAIAANSSATVQLNASKTYYASYQKEMTATFNYWNGTAAATAKASAIRYMNYNEAYVQSTITTPEVVTASAGKESTTFSHVSSSKNGTAVTVNTATLTYYAVYSKTVKATLKTYNDQSTEKNGTAYAYYDGTTLNASIALGTTGNATNSSVVYEPRHWSTSDSADASSSVALNGTASIINDTTYYASYKKDFEATFNYWNGTAKASKKETKTRFMNYKGTLKQTNYDIPAEAKANAGDYTYKHITTGTATTSTAVTPSTANATYYTVYTRTLTVEYDGNGSTSGTTASQTATQTMNANGAVSSHNFTLQANGFSKTGYTFNKWALGSASGTQYAAGATYTFNPAQGASKNVKFFANWTANPYTIAFNGNGSTSGTTASQNATYNQDITLNENGFTRAYKVKYNVNGGNAIADATATYTFAGWKLNNTGALIENKATVKNLATTGTATLFAQWNAGSVTLPNAIRTGYTFVGWFKDEDLTQSAGAVGTALTPTAETTLYAKWTANSYTVTADANGGDISTTDGWTGSGTTATKSVTYDSTYGTLPSVSRTGYTFKGWSIDKIEKLPNGYERLEYIQSNGTQYIDSEYKPGPNTGIESTFEMTDLTNQQRLFGMSSDASVEGTISYDFYINSGNCFAFAYQNNKGNWRSTNVPKDKNKHTLYFNNNDRKIIIDSSSIYQGSLGNSVTNTSSENMPILARKTLDKSNVIDHNAKAKLYTFKIYENGTIVRNYVPCKNASGEVGLYETMQGKFYGKATGDAFTYGSDVYLKDTSKVETASDHKIYAIWEANPYTVTADAMGGTFANTDGWTNGDVSGTVKKTVTYDSTYGTLPTLADRPGYTFKGWNGKNKFDEAYITKYKSSFNDHKLIFDGSSVSGNTGISIKIQKYMNNTYVSEIYVSANTGYHKIVFTKDNTFDRLCLRMNTNIYDPQIYINAVLEDSKTYTLSYVVESFDKNTAQAIISNIMIEEGDTATPYEPYYITSETPVTTASNHTLTAIWQANPYTVTANANGGTIGTATGWNKASGNATATKTINYDSAYGTLPEVSRTGYTFKGWSKNLADLLNEKNYTVTHHANRTTSEFKADGSFDGLTNQLYIRINGNSSTSNIDTSWKIETKNSINVTAGKEYILSFYVRSKNSSTTQYMSVNNTYTCTWIEWNNGTKTRLSTEKQFANDGNWHLISEKFTVPSGVTSATIVIGNDIPNIYGTNSYIDIGGIQFAEGDIVSSYYIADSTIVKTASAHTIYARWEANKYTVVFNKNADNATGTMEPQEFTYDKAQNLTANGFSRTGYTFAGWATSASGSVVHTDGKSVSNLTATANGTVNLYAKWNPKKLTINYNKNDGTTTKSTETFTYDGNMNDNYFAPNDDLQYRDNYVFKGWSFKTDGSDNVRYAFKDKVGETWFINQVGTAEEKTINLYAIWESANYSVSVSGNKTYYYLTLKDAVDKADASGSTITFLQTEFTDTSSALTIDKTLTINTNGKTGTMSNGITVSSGKTVTFTGSGTIKKTSGDLITNSGTVVVNGPNLEAGAITINGGNVTVTAGTVKGGTNAIKTTGANTVTIGTSGGTVSTTAPVITGTNGSAIVMSSTSSTFNFYDGKIAGKTTATVRGTSTSYDVKGTVNYPSGYGAHTAQNSSNGNLYETTLVEVTVNVSPTTMYLNLNNNTTGTITVSGNNYGTIEYSSTDQTVATVNNSTGVVTAVKSGTTTIKVKDKNSGVEKTITVIIDTLSPTWTITVKSIT